jgi:hypothetical protein
MNNYWSDEQEQAFLREINNRMQGTYSTVLGNTTQAYDMSDKLGTGIARAVRIALVSMGLRPEGSA